MSESAVLPNDLDLSNPGEAGANAEGGDQQVQKPAEGAGEAKLDAEGNPVVKPAEGDTEGGESDPLLAFQKEAGLSPDANPAGNTEGVKPGQLSPEAEREVQRRTNEANERMRLQAQRDGVKRDFDARLPAMKTWLAEQGMSPQNIDLLADQFTIHHGQSAEVTREEVKAELSQTYRDAMTNAAKVHIPEIVEREGEFSSTEEFMDAVVEGARKGYVADKEVNARVNKALKDFKVYLEGKGLIQGTKAVPGTGGAGAATGSPDSVLDDPHATAEQKALAFEKKYGFKPNQ